MNPTYLSHSLTLLDTTCIMCISLDMCSERITKRRKQERRILCASVLLALYPSWGDYIHFFPFLWTARLGEAAFVGLSAVRLFPGFVFGRFVPGMLRSGLGHVLL